MANNEFSRLRERIANWGDAGAVFRNSGWLVGENLLKMGLALAISGALARSLGPSHLGMLRWSMAVVAMCSSFTNLGLYGIVVKELAAKPSDAPKTLGTTAVLYLLGSTISTAICVSWAVLALGDEPLKLHLVLILTVGVLFHAPRIYILWFQYRVRSKFAVWAKSIPSILSGIAVVIAAATGAHVVTFALIIVADTILAGVALTALGAIKRDVPKKLKFEGKTAKGLLSQSWPLIASKFAAVAYLKIDQVMIGNKLEDSDVGIYAVAVDISEVWYILPSALAASAFTGIVSCYVADRKSYRARMQDLLDVMVIAAFSVIGLVYLLGTPLIVAVAGPEYIDAAAILRIHILACPFIFMGNVLSKSIITEGYLKFSLVRHLLGATLNIALNLYLIPSMGGIGAAWATLISYAAASYFACLLHPRARVVMRQMTRSLLFPLRLVRPF